jgi:hypothetical protein
MQMIFVDIVAPGSGMSSVPAGVQQKDQDPQQDRADAGANAYENA